MRYSFGVPAWLGALRVGLVLVGLPTCLGVACLMVGRHLGWSSHTKLLAYVGVFSVMLVGQFLFVLWRTRLASASSHRTPPA